MRKKSVAIVKAGWNFADNLDVIVLLTTLSAFLAYPLLWRPREVQLDDMADWGMKGPGTASLSENMRGVYYLSGAKQTSRCNATEQRDRTLCLDGYHRPLAFGFDMSYCKRVPLHNVEVRHAVHLLLGPVLAHVGSREAQQRLHRRHDPAADAPLLLL